MSLTILVTLVIGIAAGFFMPESMSAFLPSAHTPVPG